MCVLELIYTYVVALSSVVHFEQMDQYSPPFMRQGSSQRPKRPERPFPSFFPRQKLQAPPPAILSYFEVTLLFISSRKEAMTSHIWGRTRWKSSFHALALFIWLKSDPLGLHNPFPFVWICHIYTKRHVSRHLDNATNPNTPIINLSF